MSSPFARRTWLLALLSAVLLIACSKPKAPTITPERVETISTNASGMIVRIVCKAFNPNAYPLPTRKASGTISVGASQLGTFGASNLPTLPAKTETETSFDIVVPWTSFGKVLTAAVGSDDLPVTVQGQAEFEAAGVSITAPFTIKSTFHRNDLMIPFLQFLKPPMALPKPH